MPIKEKGFTFPEITMGIALLSIILGLTFFAFRQSIDSFQETELTIHLTERLHSGINILIRDLRETGINTISSIFLADPPFADPNFPNSYAWTMATARDIAGIFAINSLYQADWQGVIIYAPFQRDAYSPRELRRYVVYEAGVEHVFPFQFVGVTDTTIKIAGGGLELHIERESGELISGPGAVGDPRFRVVSSMVALTAINRVVGATNIYQVTLRTEGKGSRGETLFREISADVHPRN